VGGGNGSASFQIAKQAPHLKIIVQDREETLKQATIPVSVKPCFLTVLTHLRHGSLIPINKYSSRKAQPRLKVSLTVNNSSRMLTRTSTRFLRSTTNSYLPTNHHLPSPIHNSRLASTAECIKRLHEASTSQTRLILVEQLVPYACKLPENIEHIEGVKGKDVPHPRLGNLGEANSDVYTADFTMGALLNSQERTIEEFVEIIEGSGWKLVRVCSNVGSSLAQREDVQRREVQGLRRQRERNQDPRIQRIQRTCQ